MSLRSAGLHVSQFCRHAPLTPPTRLHVDMDAFFAAVEELDQPALVSSRCCLRVQAWHLVMLCKLGRGALV